MEFIKSNRAASDVVRKEVTCDVILVLAEKKWQSGMSQLRIVSWNGGKPSLEKRTFRPDPEYPERWRTGKASGFNAEDFKVVMERREEIGRLMDGGKPKAKDPLQDEIPF